MIKIWQLLLISISLVLSQLAISATPEINNETSHVDEGWHLYEEEPPTPDTEPEQNVSTPRSSTGENSRMLTLPPAKWLRENMQSLIDNAQDNPTPENAAIMLFAQQAARQKAQALAFASKAATLKYPALVTGSYASYAANKASGRDLNRRIDEFVFNLGKTGHTLIYFYDPNCEICIATSKSLFLFAARYEWEIIPVNATGTDEIHPELEKFRSLLISGETAKKLASQLNITSVPTLAVGSGDDFIAILNQNQMGSGDFYGLGKDIIDTLWANKRITKAEYESFSGFNRFSGKDGIDFMEHGVGDIRNVGSPEKNKVLLEAKGFWGHLIENRKEGDGK